MWRSALHPARRSRASSRSSCVAAVYCLPFYLLVAIALETTAQTYKTPLRVSAAPALRQLLRGLEHRRPGWARPSRSRAA